MPTPRKNGVKLHFQVQATHDNTTQEIVRITVDKLRLALISHLDKFENAKSWQVPLSLLITIALVFCTANFKQAFGISAGTWEALFIFATLACFVWLVISLKRAGKSPSIDSLINKIKNAADE